MKELSVIIPMYNASPFIVKCIDSIIAQENVDMEIIVVNDSSTDNSFEIVRTKYSDDNVRLFSKENGGASSARNFGIKKAIGKYIMFIDADDWLENDMICRKCIDKSETDNLDMCIFNYRYFNNESQHYSDASPIRESLLELTDAANVIREMVTSGLFPASPCFRVLRKDFIFDNNLFFIENTTAEDIEWFTHVLASVKRFGFVNDAAYIYRKNVVTSVTGSRSNQKCKNLMLRIKDASKWVFSLNNVSQRESLFSALAYEYSILLGNIAHIANNKELIMEAKTLKYLLNFKLFPKVKYLSIACKVFGIRFIVGILGIYIRNFAKSNKA